MDDTHRHHYVYLDPQDLHAIRRRIGEGDEALALVYAQLLADADRILGKPITSVLDKTGLAASGDKQDFHAIGAYSWPNPDTRDGLPYVRRDGMRNPDAYASAAYDKGRLQSMVDDVKVLSLAYFHSGSDLYAAKAADFLTSWFINPLTRMNPNLRHAAAQPGVNDGRHSGIIEGVILIELLDYVALLTGSDAWSDADVKQLSCWFLQLSEWMVKSSFGRQEICSTNNHGTYFLAQVMAFSLFGGNKDRARQIIPLVRRQVARQFSRDGSMPREIDRPNAFFYSIYGLRAFVVLARLADYFDTDLWNYRIRGEDTPAIANSFHFLLPYLQGRREWERSRLDADFSPHAIEICRMAGRTYRAQQLDEAVRFLVSQPFALTKYDSLTTFSCVEIAGRADGIFDRIAWADPKPIPATRLAVVVKKVMRLMNRLGIRLAPRIH